MKYVQFVAMKYCSATILRAGVVASLLLLPTACGGGRMSATGKDGATADGPRPDGAGDGNAGCVDLDGDGYGTGCASGPDCNDLDPFHHVDCPPCSDEGTAGCPCPAGAVVDCYDGPDETLGVAGCKGGTRRCTGGFWSACEGQVVPLPEQCNGRDDDCDGTADEGVAGECGDCDPDCRLDSVGVDGEAPWNPTGDNSEGVKVEEESGGIVLDSTAINTHLIWVSNTNEGTVSKVDTRTFAQLGRYRTGSDPSRTSVNTLGDVYVGNRAGLSVTKISALGDRCPDTNGDGVVTTSHGADLLAWGQDDCVLWRTDLPGHGIIRAVAAQDEYILDGGLHPYVWVGGWSGYAWKLDGETGAIVVNATPAPVPTYGFALDGHGNLWIESGSGLGRIDTNRCRDDASCAGAICGDDGDDCVKQRITQPVGGYGITVDFKQRVWIGGALARYDPAAPAGTRWTRVNPGSFTHGVTADGVGFVWGAAMGTVWRVNADNPALFTNVAAAAGFSAKGAAVDSDGKIWMINISHNNATVITPGPDLATATAQTNVSPVFAHPYVYSDMTGTQLRLAMRPRGWYRVVLTGCEEDTPEWRDLVFEAEVPAHTQVAFRVRTAATRDALASAAWVIVATVPSDTSPASIADALARDGVTGEKYLELEITLSSEVTDSPAPISPVVYGVSATHICPDIPLG